MNPSSRFESYSYSVRRTVLVLEASTMTAITFDHEKLGVCRFSIDYVAQSFEAARGLSEIEYDYERSAEPEADADPERE